MCMHIQGYVGTVGKGLKSVHMYIPLYCIVLYRSLYGGETLRVVCSFYFYSIPWHSGCGSGSILQLYGTFIGVRRRCI